MIYETSHPQQITLLGPFTSLFKHLEHSITCYIRLIESSQWAVDESVSSYLIYRSPLDVYLRILLADSMYGDAFYLRHQNDKGDHILVNGQLDIVGTIDWEWLKVVGKPFVFLLL